MENTNYHEILSFANQNPVCHLATVEGNQPRVRGMLMWFADETGFYFHTGSVKQIASQIQDNPNVEIAFLNTTSNPGESAAVRVSGKAEIINDQELEKRLFTERPWILENVKVAPHASVVIFRINNGEAYKWTMQHNLHEDKIPRVKI